MIANENITSNLFDDWARKGKGNSMADGHSELVEALCNTLKFKNKSVLDVGCGVGKALSKLQNQNPELLAGIDLSEEMIKIAKSNLPKGDFKVGSALDLPWNSSYFDFVISIEAMYYFDNINTSLKEIGRVLKPNGRFASIIEYYSENLGSHVWAENLPMKISCLSSDQWKTKFEEAGFKDIKISKVHRKEYKSKEEFKATNYFPTYKKYKNHIEVGALFITGIKEI